MPAPGETEGTYAIADETARAPAQNTQPQNQANVALTEAVYELINNLSGQQASTPNKLGFIIAGAFLAAAIVLLLTLKQGTNPRQLLVGLVFLAVVNLLVGVVWASRKIEPT